MRAQTRQPGPSMSCCSANYHLLQRRLTLLRQGLDVLTLLEAFFLSEMPTMLIVKPWCYDRSISEGSRSCILNHMELPTGFPGKVKSFDRPPLEHIVRQWYYGES